ncbi:hypothetical protein [Streptomyces viridochromogenes]|uniref:hypothetical protein n=1 Tax=Streptomyces viridochromogenes TaxID=1938 RepID=UPI000AFF3310|nr:hypothetical protein [Streptomyces viridochromogenes]
MIDSAYACALYPIAAYQLTAAALRAAFTPAVGDERAPTREQPGQEKEGPR